MRVAQVLLVVLAVSQLVIGVYALAAPLAFFDAFPLPGHAWVALLPPYNEHLVRDVGAYSLALATALTAAAWWLDRRLVIVAVVAFLVFTVPHTVFHFAHLEHFPLLDAVLQQGGFLVQIVLAVVVLVLAARRRASEWTS